MSRTFLMGRNMMVNMYLTHKRSVKLQSAINIYFILFYLTFILTGNHIEIKFVLRETWTFSG